MLDDDTLTTIDAVVGQRQRKGLLKAVRWHDFYIICTELGYNPTRSDFAYWRSVEYHDKAPQNICKRR